jgi:site-specific DNA-methyltransferase (adenine-specific)
MASHAHRVMTASTTTVRKTPVEFYAWLDGQLHFTVDVCADEKNHQHPRYFSEKDNGLLQSWEGETFFMNPPYGAQILSWMKKARDSCILDSAMGALLVPARVDTGWWRQCVMQSDGAAGRLRSMNFDAKNQVLWFRWERLTVGLYHHDQRICFDEMSTGAPFPASVIFMAHPRRRPVKPQLLSSLPDTRDWTLLVEQWP